MPIISMNAYLLGRRSPIRPRDPFFIRLEGLDYSLAFLLIGLLFSLVAIVSAKRCLRRPPL